MPKLIDLTGQRFGRLVVLSFAEKKNRRMMWNCICDCGNKVVVCGTDMRSGNTQSCGCQRKENFNHKKHEKHNTRVYRIWKGIKSRCFNPNRKGFHHYGGRGITMCDEWKDDFQAFYDWAMSHGYEDNLTIDRIDVNGNYEPLNCRWVDSFTQGTNKSDVVFVEYNGEKHPLSVWAEITGIKHATLYNRIVKLRWTPERALTEKKKGS